MGVFDFLFGDDDAAKKTVTENTKSTSKREIDPETRKYFMDILGQGQKLLTKKYTPYKGERIAEFSPDQEAAMSGIMGLQRPEEYGQASNLYSQAGRYAPGQLEGPESYRPDSFSSGYRSTDYTAGPGIGQYGGASPFERMGGMERYAGPTGVGQAGAFGGAEAAQYMSPYQQNVTNIAARKAQEENARQMMLGGLRSQLGGGRGGSGEAVMRANLGRSLVQDIGDIYGKGQQAAYQNAQDQYERDRASRLGYGQANLQGAQNAYALNQATQAQNVAQNVAQYNAAEQARQNAYGLDLQAQRQNEDQRLAAFNASQQAQQFGAQNALDAYRANQQAQQFAAQQNAAQNLAAFQANESARQFGAQNAINAAQGLGSLASTMQGADIDRLNAQLGVGALRTGRAQALKDINYQNYLDKRNWPTSQFTQIAPIMQNMPYNATTSGTSSGSTQTYEPYTGGLLGRVGQVAGTIGQFANMPWGGGGGGGGFSYGSEFWK